MSDTKFEYGNRSWVSPPVKWMWIRRRGRPPLRDFRVMIPTILSNLAPATVFDPTEAWAKEKEREAAAAAAAASAAASSASSSKSGKSSSSSGTKKKEDIIREKADQNRLKERYITDHERIVNKKREGGIPALLTINQRISTDRGRLELMLEVLALAVQSGDMTTAVDVFWAIRDNKAYIEAMNEIAPAAAASSDASAAEGAAGTDAASIEERVKVIMRGINGMNMGALQKECKARNVNLTGVKANKEGLVAAIRKHLMETEGQAAPAPEPPAKESKKKSSSSSAAAEAPAAPAEKSAEVLLVESFKSFMDRVESHVLADKDITATQLTSMSHLLPPLSPFYQEWRLDDWQKRALR